MAVFDLEFGGDARYGKFFAVVEDKVAVERPVVDTVGILSFPSLMVIVEVSPAAVTSVMT